MLTLRPYQTNACDNIINDWKAGYKSLLTVMPTGSGKTICFVDITKRALRDGLVKPGDYVLVLSHLSLLTLQTKEKYERFLPEYAVGILQAQVTPSLTDRVVISTMQSARDFSKIFEWLYGTGRSVGLIITDESHRAFCGSYDDIFETFPDALRLDVTASPFKGKSLLTGQYDKLSYVITLQELIDQKYLVPPELRVIEIDKLDSEQRVAIVLRTYIEHERGKKSIVFLRSKKECELMANAFYAKGIRAQAITDETNQATRDVAFDEYDNGDLDVLISVDVLTAGFDSWKCENIFQFKSESPATFIQRTGRALRPEDGDSVKPHHAKQTARIYCFGDPPTIKNKEFEKTLAANLNPPRREDCETVMDDLEFLEFHELIDTPDYRFTKEVAKVCAMADRLDMVRLKELINTKNFPEQYLSTLPEAVSNFRSLTWGRRKASASQKRILSKNGFNDSQITGLTCNGASLIIDSIATKKGWNKKDHPTLSGGRYDNVPIFKIPHAYRSWVLKNNPDSINAKRIKAFQTSKP